MTQDEIVVPAYAGLYRANREAERLQDGSPRIRGVVSGRFP